MEATSNAPPTQGHSLPSSISGLTQIRSRVTVVCAECKRLKLKCDRRTPCNSCIKRDTVSRCVYSAAAAEKIDVQSLHNRVLTLEAQISQLASGRMKLPSDLDRALLAVGASGSSVLISLDDIAGLWLEHLDLSRDGDVDLSPAVPNSPEPETTQSLSKTPLEKISGIRNKIIPNPIPQLVSNTVTPELLALLPSTSQRPALLDVLASICRMHPSFNFPHFRARISLMFVDQYSPEIGIGPSRASPLEKPNLSFFAAATAGFALALQCAPNPTIPVSPETTSSTGSPPPAYQPTAASLLSLSGYILQAIGDFNEPYDLDFLYALILRCLCMLHDGHPRVNQGIFSAVGQMVNIARVMGLAKDPDEFPRKYSVWEAEMRRRVWWDVFYYDVFVSDCMGFPPIISDDQHTCRLPADVDEEAFVPKSVSLPPPSEHLYANNFSYFLLKCKLAQLVKNMKKRVNLGFDQSASNSSGANEGSAQDPCLETATQAEIEVKQFLNDLPQAYQLDLDADPFDPTYSSSSNSSAAPTSNVSPAYLIVQRCELVIIAHQLILKLFLPFLRRPGIRSSDNSLIASINSAHSIIKAASIIKAIWHKQPMGGGDAIGISAGTITSSHGVFYPFSRQLFDAAVVAAHIVIRCPQSIVSSIAMDDLRLAISILQSPGFITSRGRSPERGGVEGAPSEAITIISMLSRKAEMARRNYAPVSAGTKRKHDEVDTSFSKGFWLPYVGSGVATDTKRGSPVVVNGLNQTSPKSSFIEKAEICFPGPSGRSGSEKEQTKYPPHPLRAKTSSSSLNSKMRSSSSLHHRRDSSHSSNLSVIPPPSITPLPPDPDAHPRPSTASSLPPSLGSEPATAPTTRYSHTTTYTIEESRNVGFSVSPTTARFSSHPPATDAQGYTQPFPMRLSNSVQASTYDSTAYNQEHDRPAAVSSYYISFPPPPLPSGFSTMNNHTQPQSHPHPHDAVQSSQHMMIETVPTAHNMDTSDGPRLAKDGQLQRRDSHSTATESSFSAEGWTTNPSISRFSHSPWDSGYTY